MQGGGHEEQNEAVWHEISVLKVGVRACGCVCVRGWGMRVLRPVGHQNCARKALASSRLRASLGGMRIRTAAHAWTMTACLSTLLLLKGCPAGGPLQQGGGEWGTPWQPIARSACQKRAGAPRGCLAALQRRCAAVPPLLLLRRALEGCCCRRFDRRRALPPLPALWGSLEDTSP